MPDHPTWLERIPALLAALEQPGAPPFLDRAAVERLFGVRRRQAIHLLHRWHGSRRGRALAASREAVLAGLREIDYEEVLTGHAAQKQRVEAMLGAARRAFTLPRLSIPAGQKLSSVTFAGLPEGIRLEPQRLTVEFSGAQNLLEKLFTLAQALANDYESLATALGEGGSDGTA